MRILLYNWNSNSQNDLESSLLKRRDCTVFSFSELIHDYQNDENFMTKFEVSINEMHPDVVFSFDFFPVISKVCEGKGVPYISWIYDNPHLTIYSSAIRNRCNFVFTFDRVQLKELKELGCNHSYHMPLAVNVDRIDALSYEHIFFDGISFVGSLYDDNFYKKIEYIPNDLRGYLDGIIFAEKKIPEADFFKNIPAHIWEQLKKYIIFEKSNDNGASFEKIFIEEFLKKNMSFINRLETLSILGKIFNTRLYTTSVLDIEGVTKCGTVRYYDEMNHVFRSSALNLNLTLKSITSGIPLRCLDIMGARGTLISNYQPELDEFFIEGKEWISFRNNDELIEKVSYYLSHEKERNDIANGGYLKVKKAFNYDVQIEHILNKVKDHI